MQFSSTQKHAASWIGISALVVLLLWLLGPVLTPFIVAAVLAYALTPLVNRLDSWGRGRMPRVVAVVLVELIFIVAVLGVCWRWCRRIFALRSTALPTRPMPCWGNICAASCW